MRHTPEHSHVRPAARIVLGSCLMLLLTPHLTLAAGADVPGTAEAPPPREAAQTPDEPRAADSPPSHTNPWDRRPVCASMFLKSDWQLTKKQRACDWLHNRLLSTSALFGAAWSAGVSQVRNAPSERGDGFGRRFGTRYVQSAFKSAAAYGGSVIAREDPRVAPPYLAMSRDARPRGLWKRTRHALAYNFVSYRCVEDCSKPEHIDRQPALSRVAGALASGYGSEVWSWDPETSHRRALYGAATAYGSTFVNALVTEFRPELAAFAGRTFGTLFGFR